MDLVSVIVPVYNAEQFLARCLNSVLNQSYEKLEVILINDGSTDNSQKICEEFAEKDVRVKLINQENSGPSVARNKGIDLANGKYISFVDADDYLEKNMIEKMINYIEQDVELVISGYNRIFKKDDVNEIQEINYYHIINMTFDDFLQRFDVLFKDYYINYLWNKLYLNEIIKTNNINFNKSINWGEDLIFNIEYLNYCNEISIISNSLYNYIDFNEDSITNNYNINIYYNRKEMYQEVRSFLLKNNAYKANKEIVENKYFESVIAFLSSSYLHKEDIDNEINDIYNDKNIRKNINFYNIDNKQKVIVQMFIKYNFKLLLKLYFEFKSMLAKNGWVFNFFKKIN